MSALSLNAPAKLNLFLHVTGRRAADGYHLLDSLVAFADYGDGLELEPGDTLTLKVDGPFKEALASAEDNLVLRAARLLQAYAGCRRGASILLHKNLPVGAGMGGGSADAAAALRELAALWGLAVEADAMHRLALQLGSDVPVCLRAPRAAWLSGAGEEVTPLALSAQAWLVLVNPGQPLLTADVFRRFDGGWKAPVRRAGAVNSLAALLALLADTQNDLETPATALMPVIGDLLAMLRATGNCLFARMSGSGATCFGLYASEAAARQAAAQIQPAYPGWWCKVARLHGQA